MVARSTLLVNYHILIKLSTFSGTRGLYRAKNEFRHSDIIEMYYLTLFLVLSNMYLHSIGKSRSARSTFINELKTNKLSGTRFFIH